MSNRKAPSRPPATAAHATRPPSAGAATTRRPSALLDTRVIYCGDNLEQLAKLPDGCVDLIYISQIRRGGDPPFTSNRNYEVFWGESKEKRAFEDRHASTAAYIDYMRQRCVELARELKKTGSFYYYCDWQAFGGLSTMPPLNGQAWSRGDLSAVESQHESPSRIW